MSHVPRPPAHQARRRPIRTWRWAAGAAFLCAGALAVTSAVNANGSDLRSSSVTDLATLVTGQRQEADQLQDRVATLNREVNRLSRGVGDREVTALQGRVDDLRDPAAFAPVSGAGVTVTLDDAPQDVIARAIADNNPPRDRLVVHQQDLQAVVNALWLGGARGITIMGQRIVTTTGIKCAGPTVILQGVPYSPPYVIRAVGDPDELVTALDGSEYIDAYRTVAARYGLTYDVDQEAGLRLKGYEGSLDLRYAKPMGKAATAG